MTSTSTTTYGPQAAACTPFPDGVLCTSLACTYGGAQDTHWCPDLAAELARTVSPRARPGGPQWSLDAPWGEVSAEGARATWDRWARRGFLDPADTAGWHHLLAHLRYQQAKEAAPLVHWGRCRSGRRWFWYAAVLDFGREGHCGEPVCRDNWGAHEHGWADSEAAMATAMCEAVMRLGGVDPRWNKAPGALAAGTGSATAALKRINTARRRARPPSGITDAAPARYLYEADLMYFDDGSENRGVREWQIARKTPRRVYFADGTFVSRAELETDTRCQVACPRTVPTLVCAAHQVDCPHCTHWGGSLGAMGAQCIRGQCPQVCPLDTPGLRCAPHGYAWGHCPHGQDPCRHGYPAGEMMKHTRRGLCHLFTSREAAEESLHAAERERKRRRPEREAEVKRLRQEMADAHPDRGGTDEGFIAARQRYEAAQAAL